VLQWIDGVNEVPHPARLLLALLADERNREIVENVTSACTSARVPGRAGEQAPKPLPDESGSGPDRE
jgi:hypothetical protein